MIEDLMVFAVGFSSATLVALLCLPAVWGRATRLVRRRLEMMVPLSAAEVVAERDGLRARAAVGQRVLEQKLDKAVASANDATIAIGRLTAERVLADRARDAVAAERDAVAAERDGVKDELARVTATLGETEARNRTLAETVTTLEGRLQAADEERRIALVERDEREAVSQQRREAIAILEVGKQSVESRLGDLQLAQDKLTGEAAVLRATLAERTRERDAARTDVLLGSTQRAVLQSQLKDEALRSEEYSGRWRAKSEALAIAERRIMDQKADLNAADFTLSELKRRFAELEGRLIGSLPRDGGAAPISDSELAELRASISGVADEALRLLGPDAGEPAPEPASPDAIRTAGALF